MISKDGNETSDKIDKTNGPAKMTISAMIGAIILLGLLIFRKQKTRRMPKYEIENMPLIEKLEKSGQINLVIFDLTIKTLKKTCCIKCMISNLDFCLWSKW